MHCLKSALLSSLRFASALLPSSTPQQDRYEVANHAQFVESLQSIPDQNLHVALVDHLPAQFKNGMFENDRGAVAAVHRENPVLATRLVAAARYDLLRRQNGNLTTLPPNTTPTVVTTTNADGSTVVATITPGGGLVTSLAVQTTTLPDGSRKTFTSTAIIPKPTGGDAGGGPQLQGAATVGQPRGVTVAGLLVLSVVFGALML